MIRIFLWKKDDPYFSGELHSARALENAWRYYIASYSLIDDTSGVDRSLVTQAILARNVRAIGADPKADGFPLSFNTASDSSAGDHGDDNVANSVENGTSSEVGDKLLNRFLNTKNEETLTQRVAVNNYQSRFQPNTAEMFFVPMKERQGAEDDVKGAEETEGERQALVKERYLLMNEGMKGLSREEVEARNAEVGKLTVEGDEDANAKAAETKDVEMVE